MAGDSFPPGFFDRADDSADPEFYAWPRLVTHIDAAALAAVGCHYRDLGLRGDVLDLMSSWVSHFVEQPRSLTVLGLNSDELAANPMATARVTHDLNARPLLPFEDRAFEGVVCCVSVDYLTNPIEVFREVGRVLQPGGLFTCTFSNRCFPTKAIKGWLAASDTERCRIVERYFELSGAFEPATKEILVPMERYGADPLYAVFARATV